MFNFQGKLTHPYEVETVIVDFPVQQPAEWPDREPQQ